jgi:hypothetical protein
MVQQEGVEQQQQEVVVLLLTEEQEEQVQIQLQSLDQVYLIQEFIQVVEEGEHKMHLQQQIQVELEEVEQDQDKVLQQREELPTQVVEEVELED